MGDGINMTGAEAIAAERRRQIEVEGYTADHDAWHGTSELVAAALCYATPPERRLYSQPARTFDPTATLDQAYGTTTLHSIAPVGWPWEPSTWKPTPGDRQRELQKAGALLAAAWDEEARRHG